MSKRQLSVKAQINNTPTAVISYIADVRNRPLFFPSLKSVSDIQGEPSAAGTTWKWTFVALGAEFQGIGRCLEHDPGKRYVFETEGGIASRFVYRAEPDGQGTQLTVDLEYTIPNDWLTRVPAEAVADAMRKAEAERVIQNLKVILDT